MARLPWGHQSRHCVFCGKVGPRTRVAYGQYGSAGGWAHKRCIDSKRAAQRVERPA